MAGSKKVQPQKHLCRYVGQVMKAKGLSARDVAERSGDEITSGYVTGIRKGIAENPSVDKVMALSKGLGVDPFELFAIGCGLSERQAELPIAKERLQALELLDLMKKVAVSPPLMKILENASRLSSKEVQAVLGSVNRLVEAKKKTRGKGKHR